MKYPVTPDGRYFVVRGRLWRLANPGLEEAERSKLTKRLMAARRAVRDAKADGDAEAEAAGHKIGDGSAADIAKDAQKQGQSGEEAE